jgi:hypothetical protein
VQTINAFWDFFRSHREDGKLWVGHNIFTSTFRFLSSAAGFRGSMFRPSCGSTAAFQTRLRSGFAAGSGVNASAH